MKTAPLFLILLLLPIYGIAAPPQSQVDGASSVPQIFSDDNHVARGGGDKAMLPENPQNSVSSPDPAASPLESTAPPAAVKDDEAELECGC